MSLVQGVDMSDDEQPGVLVNAGRPVRIALVVTHPIQYFTPWYREMAKLPGIEFKAFFCAHWGVEAHFDKNFGINVQWDVPLLEGYDYEFLEREQRIKGDSIWQVDHKHVGEVLSHFKPDVVEIAGYNYPVYWRVLRWCNRNGIPVILHSDSNGSARRAWWRRLLKEIPVRLIYRSLDAALASGDNNRLYHLRFGLPEERIFPRVLPVDCTRMVESAGDRVASRKEIRSQYGIPDDAFVVVFAGKLIEIKCPIHLLQAVKRCRDLGEEVWALLVGEGKLRPELEAYIREHNLTTVVLAGFINQSVIGKYYGAADVATLMSSYEPKGQAIPEAGSLGCPAVVSDTIGCVGPNDCARPGVNALVFPWGDIDAFADRILQLKRGSELYRRMSEEAVRVSFLQDCTVAAKQMLDASRSLRAMGPRPSHVGGRNA